MTREDNVTVIYYNDGSVITEHADGTKIHSNSLETLIESPGYAPVKIVKYDGYSEFETFLSNGSMVKSSYLGIRLYSYDKKIHH